MCADYRVQVNSAHRVVNICVQVNSACRVVNICVQMRTSAANHCCTMNLGSFRC